MTPRHIRIARLARTAASALVLATAGVGPAWAQAAPQAPAKVATPDASRPAARPNILFVLVDDLGARDLGFSGSRLDETPNLDAFARHSARFDAAYAPSPVCSPSRAAIMTGKDPARLGITTWIPGGEYTDMPLVEPVIPAQLPLEETTIAEALKANGYRTFFAGKWHLGGAGYLPTDQGFDTNLGGGEYGQPPHGYYVPYGNAYLPDGPKGEYLEDRLTDETIRFLSSAKTEKAPFFAFLSLYAVHTPIQPSPDGSIEHFKAKAARLARSPGPAEAPEGIGRTKLKQDNAAYASMVHAVDRNFGRLTAALDRLGLRENTIVIFTSDNGGLSTLDPAISLYKNGAPTSNAPLRAGKGWTYEGGVQVPLLIGGPGVKTSRIGAPVVLTDLYATMLDMAMAAPVHNDSVSLAPLLNGGRVAGERTILWHYPHYHGSGSKPASAIRRGNWKLIRDYESDRWELYDLAKDPFERTDLAARRPVELDRMKREMARMIGETGAKLPTHRM